MIRAVTECDAAQLCDIYNYYALHTTITFEVEAVSAGVMTLRIQESVKDGLRGLSWLVWEEDERVLGFCYASNWKGRSAYRHSVESTVYVHPDYLRRGIGLRLYEALLAELRLRGIHAVIGGIALPNAASIGLHERLGFEKVAHFREVGRKFDRWIDVGYWQLCL